MKYCIEEKLMPCQTDPHKDTCIQTPYYICQVNIGGIEVVLYRHDPDDLEEDIDELIDRLSTDGVILEAETI